MLCGEQYRLYYISKLRPKVASANLVFGTTMHQVLADFLYRGADPMAAFVRTWEEVQGTPLKFSLRESWSSLNIIGQGLLEKFVKEELPKLGQVHAVEKPFTLGITGLDLPIIGVIDLIAQVGGKMTVVDFKTSSSRYEPHEAALSDQLTTYRLAEPGIEQLALCVLVKTKEPRIEWHHTARGPEQLTEYLTKAGYVAQEIAASRFYKRPGKWCSWCDYLSVCMGDSTRAAEILIRSE